MLAALRLGLFQLLFLGRESPTTPRSTRASSWPSGRDRGGAGLVNAVLRRAARGGTRHPRPGSTTRRPSRRAILHSVPGWLAARWWEELGADEARALLGAVNQPAESALRVNTLRAAVDEVARALPVASRPAPGLPEGLVLDGPFDAQGSELWQAGRDHAAVARLDAASRGCSIPGPGERVLDLCAAPGGKTTHLAALIGGPGRDRRGRAPSGAGARRSSEPAGGCAQRASGSRSLTRRSARTDGPFDRVLVDPPCSGLGTLQSRPDLRWRARPEAIEELAALQARILAAGAGATRARRRSGLLGLHDLARRGAGRRSRRFLRDHPDFERRRPRRRGVPEALGASTAGPASSCCPTATAPTGSSSPGCASGVTLR